MTDTSSWPHDPLFNLLFKIVNGLLTVPARCLPSLPNIYTCKSLSEICTSTAKFGSVQIFFLAGPRTILQWNDLQLFANIETLNLTSFKEQLQAASGADPGGVMGVKRPPLQESY